MRHSLTFILLFTVLGYFHVFSQVEIQLEEFASGFNNPLTITHAFDDRLFIVEQEGFIQIVDAEGNVNPEPFLTITDRVKAGGEQGLLGLAFHPDYVNSGYFYVNYTGQNDSTHISRFSVSNDPDIALAGSEKVLLTIAQPYTNHNGGDLSFGPDGYLYIGIGDGGSGGDPGNRAQDSTVLLGKLLRIDVDGGDPYGIPSDNPFVDEPGALDEIFALGLRNPWRFSFDRQTGDIWIADVGQNQYEEINYRAWQEAGGGNYGWRCYEGNHEYNPQGCPGDDLLIFPAHEYSHDATGGCSVTGGYVYRGTAFPSLQGSYFFADYCNDKIWSLYGMPGNWSVISHGQYSGNNFSAFGENFEGELFITGLSSGVIFRIVSATSGSDNPGNAGLRIYPNPFEDSLIIESEKPVKMKVNIYDAQGRPVIDTSLENGEQQLNTRSLSAGVYLVKIASDEGVQYRKLIKKE